MRLPMTYIDLRKQILEQEGENYPGKIMIEMELLPGYERAKKRLLPYIQTINEAHLIMLIEQNIIDPVDGAVIMKALKNQNLEEYKNSVYDSHYEDLYFCMESRLIKQTDGIAGNLHLARSRNDMCVAWSHMAVRDGILNVMNHLLELQNVMRLFAEEHKNTLYVIHTHTQHAQPGLLGHYFIGVADMIGRGFKRLARAYEAANLSPMGAAAVTTSGFPVSRERVAELAGFSGVIENAYDAIGNSDYLTETAGVLALNALDIGRVVTDLILWSTQELNVLRIADGYISTSSIMPQKRNPIALEHLRASLSVTKGMADTVLTGFLKSPYGDISDYEDIEDSLTASLELFDKNIRLLSAVIGTIEVNKELLEKRAYESFSVVTEIADQMYRSYKIPFRKAHSFVSYLVKRAGEKQYNLSNISKEFFAGIYEEFFGISFKFDFQTILESIDPWHFVKCREVRGGTGERAMNAMLDQAKEEILKNQIWLEEQEERLKKAEQEREQAVKKVMEILNK